MAISAHALKRYREHYPDADEETALIDVRHSELMDHGLVSALLQRPRAARIGAAEDVHHRLAVGRRGIWVVGDRGVITYLRLGLEAQRIVGDRT